jgi:hypothetical protein
MAKNSKTTARARKKHAAPTQVPPRSSHGRATPKPAVRRKSATPKPRSAGQKKPGIETSRNVPNFKFYVNPTLALVCLPADAPALFPLRIAADLTGVHPEMLRYYCRLGLLGPDRNEGEREPTFDEEALQEVKRIEHYRRHLAISRQALPLVCELRREAERQQIEIHFLRGP